MIGNGFVKMLATISDVGIQCNGNEPLVMCSQMKWYRTSMCFVQGEITLVLASEGKDN
jgi:hypothetical protein